MENQKMWEELESKLALYKNINEKYFINDTCLNAIELDENAPPALKDAAYDARVSLAHVVNAALNSFWMLMQSYAVTNTSSIPSVYGAVRAFADIICDCLKDSLDKIPILDEERKILADLGDRIAADIAGKCEVNQVVVPYMPKDRGDKDDS